METIALFGGSFDPPHIGHIAVVEAVLKTKLAERVVVMPTFLNPFKSEFCASAEQRLEWLEKIFANNPHVDISDFEVQRGKKTPSIITVLHLLKRYKNIYLVIGADNLASLKRWERFEELNKLVTFMVAMRDNISIPKGFIPLHVDVKISSSRLREKIEISKLPKECAIDIYQFYKDING